MAEFNLLQATVLALIQGLTEFLPISSSAHLILPSALLGWPDQGLAFDVAVHLGTLLAVILYFRRDLSSIAAAMLRQASGGEGGSDARMGWLLILATLPVVLAGLLLKDIVDTQLRSVAVITVTTLLFGLLLLLADVVGRGSRGLSELKLRDALLIGLAQVLALVPGTSRSGVTMTAALLCGLDRQAASRFSFLLAIPAIGGASLLLLLDLLDASGVDWAMLVYALLLAFVCAWLCIHYFLKLIGRIGFLPFVIYRLLLGLLLLFIVVL